MTPAVANQEVDRQRVLDDMADRAERTFKKIEEFRGSKEVRLRDGVVKYFMAKFTVIGDVIDEEDDAT